MKIDSGSLAFGYNLLSGAGNPNWSTALGQSNGYKIKSDADIAEILEGMIHKAVSPAKVSSKFGKGGAKDYGKETGSRIMVASLFSEVYINDQLIDGGNYILIIYRDISESHKGRLKLNYGIHNSYDDTNFQYSNDMFWTTARAQLGLAEDACLFVYDISIQNQEKLVMKTVVVNADGNECYDNSKDRKETWDRMISGASKCTPYEQKKKFEVWLRESKGSSSDADSYPNQLDYRYNDLNHYKDYTEFYEIQDIDEFDEYRKQIQKDPRYDDVKRENPHFETELNKYGEFLHKHSLIGYNKIYYGIPGCGKSYYIEHKVLNGVDKGTNVFRTTFYLDYSNSDFIGQIYPQADEEGNVTYDYKPGPFTSALERAYNSTDEMVYLVIEEINRGNAAAILGDIFQLLDRLEDNFDGRVAGDSEYPINNQFIEEYLRRQEVEIPEGQNKIFIPHNLTILATMNTSDQNVFPLDTAFKRRWQRERVVASIEDCKEFKDNYIPYTDVTWEDFVTEINDYIIKNSADGMVLEDKQMGPFFASKDMFIDKSLKDRTDEDEDSKKEKINALKKFVYNIIDYLYNDVCKFDKEYLFKENISFNEICESAEKGKNIIKLCFKDGLFDNDSKGGKPGEAGSGNYLNQGEDNGQG